MELDGNVAVVIGGGSGIGRGIATVLARRGMKVVVADIELEAAAESAAEIADTGAEVTAVRVDATDRGSLEDLATAAEDAFGGVNVLSNNVGVAVLERLDEATEADWAWAIEFNLMSMVRGVEVFRPLLKRNPGSAHIVNTASTAGLVTITSDEHGWGAGLPIGLYTATKYAAVGFSESLRHEVARDGIGVSVLCPGGVATNLRETSARNRPERFGGTYDPGAREYDEMPSVTTVDVGEMVADGIVANRLHVLTHPEWADDVTRRYEATMADFEFYKHR